MIAKTNQLALSLLGTFEARLNKQPIHKFEYDKVRALLAYLAVEYDRPHRRDVLTGLFWPEQSDSVARKSLNQALYTLRKAVGDKKGWKCRLFWRTERPLNSTPPPMCGWMYGCLRKRNGRFRFPT